MAHQLAFTPVVVVSYSAPICETFCEDPLEHVERHGSWMVLSRLCRHPHMAPLPPLMRTTDVPEERVLKR